MQYGFWKVAVIRKHRALAAWRHAAPPLFVGSILLGAVLTALTAGLGMSSAAVWIAAGLGGGLIVYALACVAAALPFAGALDLPTLLILPGVMAAYHVAYGFGFLIGLLKPAQAQAKGTAQASAFTVLTR